MRGVFSKEETPSSVVIGGGGLWRDLTKEDRVPKVCVGCDGVKILLRNGPHGSHKGYCYCRYFRAPVRQDFKGSLIVRTKGLYRTGNAHDYIFFTCVYREGIVIKPDLHDEKEPVKEEEGKSAGEP